MSEVDRDVAHLLSGRSNLSYGGIAWLSSVCNATWGYGVLRAPERLVPLPAGGSQLRELGHHGRFT